MAYFSLPGRLKLYLNNEGSIRSKNQVQNKLNECSKSGGVVGFNENDAKRNGYSRNVRILASKGDGTKSVNENVDYRAKIIKDFDDVFDIDDDDDDDIDVDDNDDDLSCFRGLVLDIAYRPINVVCWKRAICLEFMDKADVLEYYDQTVNSPSGSFNIPAVLRVPHLLQVVKRKRVRNTLSRKNILCRDDYMCQYCYARNNLTVDHVIPMSRGGKWEWENLVTACSKCNSKKGQKTLEEANMTLMKVPKAPKQYDILAIPLTSAALKMLKIKKGTPQEWHQYLP